MGVVNYYSCTNKLKTNFHLSQITFFHTLATTEAEEKAVEIATIEKEIAIEKATVAVEKAV